jgi:hypothetical protein
LCPGITIQPRSGNEIRIAFELPPSRLITLDETDFTSLRNGSVGHSPKIIAALFCAQ